MCGRRRQVFEEVGRVLADTRGKISTKIPRHHHRDQPSVKYGTSGITGARPRNRTVHKDHQSVYYEFTISLRKQPGPTPSPTISIITNKTDLHSLGDSPEVLINPFRIHIFCGKLTHHQEQSLKKRRKSRSPTTSIQAAQHRNE